MNFNRYLSLAKALYEFDFEHRCQHFTFTLYKNRIISIGKNNLKTNPNNFKVQVSHFLPGTCSEYNSIRKVKNLTNLSLSKMTLVNVRINRQLEFCLSKPCSSCARLIEQTGIKRVFYTNDNGHFERY